RRTAAARIALTVRFPRHAGADPMADPAGIRPARQRPPLTIKRWRQVRERAIEGVLFLAAFSAVAITIAIVATLLIESASCFAHVSIVDFLTDTQWTPLFEHPRYGILPLVAGTLTTSFIALLVAIPLGAVTAIYLSEFAKPRVREIVKPILELISGVPTVVFGYFALLCVPPMLQTIMPDLPGFNMLGP